MKRARKAAKPSAPAKAEQPKAPVMQRLKKSLIAWLPFVAIVLGTRVALAEAYRIPSGSMEPTLLVGDWLFVNKLRFGPHIPFTPYSLPGYAEPKRNDVVVFVSPPQDPSIRITPSDVTPMLVKRVVAMGGDTLLMRDGELTINGIVVPRRNNTSPLPADVGNAPQPIFEWQHRIEITGSRFGPPVARPSLHQWGPLVVPPGTLFMMGDHRDNSVDSRYYGPVPRANVRGTPMFVYYAYDAEAGLDYFRAVTEIRWRRIGTWIR
jgi:signal peptidase I